MLGRLIAAAALVAVLTMCGIPFIASILITTASVASLPFLFAYVAVYG